MSPDDTSPAGATILVVEDEEAVRDVFSQTLEFAGYRVVAAGDGEAGLARFAERGEDVALLLLDATLDGTPASWEVLRAVRARRPDLPVLVTSGSEEDVALDKVTPPGEHVPPRCSFLQKPVSVADLEAKVAAILGS